MMHANSEIRKYIWLDFSLQRTLAMPLVLLAVFALVHLWVGDSSQPKALDEALHQTSSTILWILTFIWGSYKAAHSVSDEIRNNCWDNIRLSPITAGQLCFGKLVGSTLYTWYGALPVLIIYASSLANLKGVEHAFFDVYITVAGTLLTHALIILLMLRGAHACNSRHAPSSVGIFILGLIVGSTLQSFALAPLRLEKWLSKTTHTIDWFGHAFTPNHFALVCMTALTIWVLVGLFRSSREILQQRARPFVWIGCVVFWIVFAIGLSYSSATQNAHGDPISLALLQRSSALSAFALAGFFTYIALFIQLTDYRRIAYNYRQKHFRQLLEILPLWAVTLTITLLTYVCVVLSFLGIGDIGHDVLLVCSLAVGFLLRDIGVVTFAQLAPNARRSGMAAFFYLALLYGLLPAIMLHGKLAEMAYFFFPYAAKTAGIEALLPVLIQCAVVAALVISRANTLRLDAKKAAPTAPEAVANV